MKFTKIIAIFIIVSIISAIEIDRKLEKKAKKSKAKSSSSLKVSSASKRVETMSEAEAKAKAKAKFKTKTGMDSNFYLRIDVSGRESCAEGRIYTRDIERPSGVYMNRLYINTTSRGGNLSKIAVRDGNKIYIPYHNINKCDHGNPSFGRRYLKFYVYNNRSWYPVKARFDWWVISTSDQARLCSWINRNIYNTGNVVKAMKGVASGTTDNYINNMQSAESSVKGNSAKEAQIKELEARVSALAKEMTNLTSQQTSNRKSIQDQNDANQKMNDKDVKFSSENRTLKSENDIREELIKNLKSAITDAQATKKKFDTDA